MRMLPHAVWLYLCAAQGHAPTCKRSCLWCRVSEAVADRHTSQLEVWCWHYPQLQRPRMPRLPAAVTSYLLQVSLCWRRLLQRCRARPQLKQPPPACCKLTAYTSSALKHLASSFCMR